MHCSNVSSGAAQAHAAHAVRGRRAEGCGEAKPVKPDDGCAASGSCEDAPRAARHEGRAQRNPLVTAMMGALKGLVPASADPAASEAADGAEAGTEPSATKDQAQALKEAAYGFAHELFQALKSVGASGSEAASGCRPHRCGAYGEPKRAASAYGGLAQGLQRLAQALAPTPAAVASGSAASAPVATDTAAPTLTAAGTPAPAATVELAAAKPAELTTVKTPAPAPATTGQGNSITISFTLNFGASAKAEDDASASNETPLLAAFKKLMLALNPKAGDPAGAEAAAGKKPAELLQAFLLQIAKTLGADMSMPTGEASPTKGSLINLAA